MIIISDALASTLYGTASANQPQIGYDNLVTTGNITSTEADADYPVTNLANPSTASVWLGTTTGEQYITVNIDSVETVDYVAIAAHNFGTANIAVSIEGDDGGGYDELVEPYMPSDDTPLIFRFDAVSLVNIRIKLAAGDAIPTAAVVYVGTLLGLQRNIYVGHTPFPYGRVTEIATGRSESGQFLGRIVVGSRVESAVSLQNLTAAWFRASLEPFLLAARESPFFFAWRPGDYPAEVGYAALTNDPQPTNQRSNGMMAVDLQMVGVG